MLRELCLQHTELAEEDIIILEDLAKNLPLIAKLTGEFIFIDCLTRVSNTAIVVAEAKPLAISSLYKNSVVGMLALRENEPAALRTLEIGIETTDLKAITQENMNVKQNTVPIKNNVGKVIGVLIKEKDITEELNNSRSMEILSETNERLAQTLNNLKDNTVDFNLINDSIIIFNDAGLITYTNSNAEHLYKKLGYKDKIIGMNFENVTLNKTDFNTIIMNNTSTEFEINISKFTLQLKYTVTKKEDKRIVTLLIKDISEIKQKEKELILKSVALKEIHHRVKNNLQTIASILRLQSKKIDNFEAKLAFKESINRVLSMAAVHEIMAQNGIEDIHIKNILSKIKDNAKRNSIQFNKNISIELIGNDFIVDSDKATSIAIVVNELLENCIKHGFCENEEGTIKIIIEKGLMFSTISVIDSGKGFNPSLRNTSSLGLNIVTSIVKDKLDGNITIESNENGTNAMIYF